MPERSNHMDAITAIAIHDTFMRTDGSMLQVASVAATWMAGLGIGVIVIMVFDRIVESVIHSV